MNSIHPDWDRLAEVVKGGGHSTTTVTTPRKKQMRKRVRRASKAADIQEDVWQLVIQVSQG